MILPENHGQRLALHNEVHARPPESLSAPVAITYLALLSAGKRGEDHRAVRELAEQFKVAPPEETAVHYSADFGDFRIKWERHTEFSRFKIIVPVAADATFATFAHDKVPDAWVHNLPGETLVATQILLLPKPAKPIDPERLSHDLFSGNPLVGASVGGGKAQAYTDVRVHSDGFARVVVYDDGLARRQAGRVIQRLVEIETYRMMALLAFPVARALGPKLTVQ
ncbi:MAG: DUF3422 family protein, partial [Pseudomonadota bacterium]